MIPIGWVVTEATGSPYKSCGPICLDRKLVQTQACVVSCRTNDRWAILVRLVLNGRVRRGGGTGRGGEDCQISAETVPSPPSLPSPPVPLIWPLFVSLLLSIRRELIKLLPIQFNLTGHSKQRGKRSLRDDNKYSRQTLGQRSVNYRPTVGRWYAAEGWQTAHRYH